MLLGGVDIGAVTDVGDLASVDHEALGQEEAGGEFEVGAGSAHRHGHLGRFLTRAANANLEWLLTRDAIALLDGSLAARKAQDTDIGGGSSKRWAVGGIDD